MTRSSFVFSLTFLAATAGAGIGVSVAALHVRADQSSPVYETSRVRTFARTRVIEQAPYTLESMTVTSHGGQSEIEWYCGSATALGRRGGAEVSLYVDGVRRASTFFNTSASGGTSGSRAAVLRWLGRLRPGSHRLATTLDQAAGAVALPLVVAPARVPEGVSVSEYVR